MVAEIFEPKFAPDSPEQQFVNASGKKFKEIRMQPNYLEQMVMTAEGLGEDYIRGAVGALDRNVYDQDALTTTILAKDFGPLEKDPAKKTIYDTAVGIARQTEEVKRALIYQEISANPEGLSLIERILLVGSLALSQLTDKIYFDEWRTEIRDSETGYAFAEMEKHKEGSSLDVLPGIPENTRWFTRKLKDPRGKVENGNIELVHYRDSLPTVPEFISTLDRLAGLLDQETSKGISDYGYSSLFKAWSACLTSDPEHQKETEDAMMTAWRKIDPEAPIFMVPWAEYDYGDPAGVAIAQTFRFGVKSTTDETRKLTGQGIAVKESIIRNAKVRRYKGTEAIAASQSVHLVWSGFGGGDVLFAPSSQVLPNDSDLRLKYGCYILPNLAQQRKGMALRERYAKNVYHPQEIEEQLRALKFTLEEQSVNEMEAHEFFHPAGVTREGLNRLGKMANLFEEWKATFGGMHAQVQERESEFAKRALATLLYAAAAYMRLDGNYRMQGYANIARTVLTLSDSLKIFTYDESGGWSLDMDNEAKIRSFWMQVGSYVDWCTSAYGRAEMAPPQDVETVKSGLAESLRNKLGYGDKDGSKEDRIGAIRQIKTVLAKN